MDDRTYLTEHLPATLDFLHRMVDINTFTANAAGVNRLAALTAETFASLGFQAEFVPSTNPAFGKHLFLSNHPAGFDGPSVALISHMDTVFPPEEEAANDFHWQPEGDRIYGPGTNDIKGGTAMIHLVLGALRTLHPQVFERVRWVVCLDASEETLSDDFGRLCIERLPQERTLAALVYEGGTPSPAGWPLVTARKGRAEFRLTATGRGAHAGNYHHQGANAIVQMAHTILKIASFTDYTQKITFTPGVIQGGSVVNRVPHAAELLVEMRAFDPAVFEAGFQKMLALDGTSDLSSADGFPAQVQVELLARNVPWPPNPATQGLYDLWSAAAAEHGLTVLQEQRGGLSDGNLLWQRYPVLDGLGPSGENAHCSQRSPDGSKQPEYVLPDSFLPKALMNITALLKLTQGKAG